MTPLQLKRLGIEISKDIIYSTAKFPNRFVYIDECLEYFRSVEEVHKKCRFSRQSFNACVDFDNGVIWDPVASVIFTNCEGMVLNEAKFFYITRRVNGRKS